MYAIHLTRYKYNGKAVVANHIGMDGSPDSDCFLAGIFSLTRDSLHKKEAQ
jgi:hypothetical protein